MKYRTKKKFTPVGNLLIDLDFYYARLEDDPQSGCINWTGASHRQGYGMIGGFRQGHSKRIMTVTHRVAMMLHTGQALGFKDNVIHTCGNNRCCNPSHMFVGDCRDRTAVMDLNGNRVPPSSDHKQRRKYKYTEEQLIFLRTASIPEIQARFNVAKSTRAAGMRWAARKHYKWLKSDGQE